MLLYQPKNGYCYNSDSMFLFEFAASFIRKKSTNTIKKMRFLDIGAGCGILGLLCAREFGVDVVFVEKNEIQAKFCAHNFENLRRNFKACDDFDKPNASLVCGDFLELGSNEILNADSIKININSIESNINLIQDSIYNLIQKKDKIQYENNKFSIAICNPPFYRKDALKSENPSLFLSRSCENLPFLALLRHLNPLLAPRGEFYFCYEAGALAEIISALLECKFCLTHARFVYSREDSSANIFLARAQKGAKSPLQILPPLFTHKSGENSVEFTKEVAELYCKLGLWSVKC